MVKIILFMLISMLFCSCKVSEKITFNQMDHTGSNLRIDGYYYAVSEGGFCSFFLYQNGMFLSNECASNLESIAELDQLLKDSDFQ